jgi:hypothetical protein
MSLFRTLFSVLFTFFWTVVPFVVDGQRMVGTENFIRQDSLRAFINFDDYLVAESDRRFVIQKEFKRIFYLLRFVFV